LIVDGDTAQTLTTINYPLSTFAPRLPLRLRVSAVAFPRFLKNPAIGIPKLEMLYVAIVSTDRVFA
jgi:hypothetical protein